MIGEALSTLSSGRGSFIGLDLNESVFSDALEQDGT
jgi:hypothetical protein